MSLQPLYLITDGGALRKQGLLLPRVEEILRAARGKIGYVQLREQVGGEENSLPATDREVLSLVYQLLPLCHQYQAKLIINRRPDLVLASGADGVHLGRHSLAIDNARVLFDASKEIGYSAHTVEEAISAAQSGAHYVFLSPIFRVTSKSAPRTPLGIAPLAALASRVTCPVFALGGVTALTIGQCRKAGVEGAAIISSLLFSPDRKHATETLLQAWEAA